VFSVEELIENTGDQYLEDSHNGTDDSIENLSQEHFKHALTKAIEGLPERERLVISLYYDEELNLREIGEVLGVSESRVCQINNQAVLRLRSRLSEWTQN
jgi:RNA polymerase sigma factor for flagellar operon FliA